VSPEIPCHRVISSTGYVAGYKGEWTDAPSGINQSRKLELLREEGVHFTEEGMLIVQKEREIMFDGPWVLEK
jgi:methylated-DNA-[protein]-cysteine S-methyltransferase